jgi:hypothetical protein
MLACTANVANGGGGGGGGSKGITAVFAATPVVGVAGGAWLSSASLLLSSLHLFLLARFRLLLRSGVHGHGWRHHLLQLG